MLEQESQSASLEPLPAPEAALEVGPIASANSTVYATSTARRVAINTLYPFAAQIATKVLMLGYAIVQYHWIGGAPLGNYFTAALLFSITGTISEWGLGTLLTREASKAVGGPTASAQMADIFRQTLALRAMISLALFVPVALFIALYLAISQISADGVWVTIVLSLGLLPGAFSGSVTALLYARERMSLSAGIGVATSALNVALGVGAILLGWGIVGLALAAFASTVVTALAFGYILQRDFPEMSLPGLAALRISRNAASSLLKIGWPLMLNALLVTLFFRVDIFILRADKGDVDVSRYQAAYSFLNFVLLITPAVTLALFPRMARHAATDRPRLAYEYAFTLKVMLIIAVPIIALTVWYAALLIWVMAGQAYVPYSTGALRILIFFLPFSFINGVTQYVLIALDRQRLITGPFAATVAFNVIANLLLVPPFGIYGAAATTILSELVLLGPFLFWTTGELGRVAVPALAAKPLFAGAATGLVGWFLWPITEKWNSGWGDFALYMGAGLMLLVVYAVVLLAMQPFTQIEKAGLRSALKRR
ncbi:MAG: flippase [Chloroflexi bacterium]|nr:flippase [Chloroflexota bacterium]